MAFGKDNFMAFGEEGGTDTEEFLEEERRSAKRASNKQERFLESLRDGDGDNFDVPVDADRSRGRSAGRMVPSLRGGSGGGSKGDLDMPELPSSDESQNQKTRGRD